MLLHAAAGGVGLIFTQWAAPARRQGHRHASPPTRRPRSPARTAATTPSSTPARTSPTRVRELTDGAGVPVVYDSIGRDDLPELARLARAGAACSSASAPPPGQVPPIDAMELAIKGSLYVTRPALADYIADPAERAALAGELFDHVGAGRIHGRDQPALRPRRRRPGPPRPRVRPQHRLVGLRPRVRGLAARSPHRSNPKHPGEPTMTQTIDRMSMQETGAARRSSGDRGRTG